MRRIKTLSFRATPLAGRARRATLAAYVGPARTAVVFPFKQGIALVPAGVLFHLVGVRRDLRFSDLIALTHNNLRLSSPPALLDSQETIDESAHCTQQ
jgi:hypothetical protein